MAKDQLIFKDAEKARDAITQQQKAEITEVYQKWADEIGKKAKAYSHKTAPSYAVAERQMKELEKQLRATSDKVANEIYGGIKSSIYTVSEAVVNTNKEWLKSLGFEGETLDIAFNYVPDEMVQKLITGQIYDSGWSLSKRIWSDKEETLRELYKVTAGGVAQNKSIYEIAKDLEKYVSPTAAKPWNLVDKDGKKIYPKQVDYNAQRLARTLVQHGYQQSFVETTKENPFIIDYVWNSNGSRACELCMDRDGTHYKKHELPMDHPNGMCTMEPNVSETLIDDLANWFNEPDGTYPEIDEFASNFGYKPNITSAFSLSGGKSDPVLTDSIRDYFLPKATREKLDKIESLKTYSDFEEYFASKGISLDTDLVKLKEAMRYEEIEAVESLCQKLVTGVEAYEDTFGPGSLSKLKRIILYDESLDVKAAYHFNMIGENDPFAGTIRFSQWNSDGREVFHELAHAFQDSNALPGEDAVSFANRMVKEANLAEDFKAYFGADQDVMDAERFADAFGFGFGRGSDVGIKFIKNVWGVIK